MILFFKTLFKTQIDTDIQHTLYLGDWNISLSQQLDTQGYLHENNTHNRDFVKNKIIEYDLKDVWRDRNPLAANFTFMKKQAKNVTKARLDFLLASPNTTGYIEAIRIGDRSSLSDHRPLHFTIEKNKVESGPGYWRFNNNLLETPEFHFGMEQTIKRTINTYASEAMPPNPTDQQIAQSTSTLAPQLLMDIILCEARAYSIKFTAIRKIYDNAEKRKKQEELDDAVRLLEADDGTDPQHSNKLIENMKTPLK